MADGASCDHDQEKFYIGVDVGTASVRAGLFNARGKLMGHAKHDIHIWTNENIMEGSYEQSSDDIWQAVCHVVKVCRGIRDQIGLDWCMYMYEIVETIGQVDVMYCTYSTCTVYIHVI